MKNILKVLVAMLAVAAVSCETYEVEDPDTTAVAPLDGRYICWAYDYDEYVAAADKTTVEPLNFFETRISATESNDPNKVWIYVSEYLNWYPYTDCTCAKIDCNVATLSFSASGVKNTMAPAVIFNPLQGGGYYTLDYYYNANTGTYPQYIVTITDGKIVLNGLDTPTGYKTDAISFAFERVDEDGDSEKFMVVGGRYTGWSEDYQDFEDFIDAY